MAKVTPKVGNIVGAMAPEASVPMLLLLLTLTIFVHVPLVLANAPGGKFATADGGDNDDPESQWGSFYDPQSVFCGDYDCYKILGFDHETWGSSPPDTKLITKNYRSMSRQWHPDKNRGRRAKERFVKINRAYEILTKKETRTEYDYLRDRPDEYYLKYGSNVLYKYAPQSDTSFVILILLAVASAFTWVAQQQKWQSVANRLIKASVEGLGSKEGGTDESLDIRERALLRLNEMREKKIEESESKANGTLPSPRKKDRLTNKERKQKEMDELHPIVAQLVKKEMLDFGGGYHQPTWRDLLLVKLLKLPLTLVQTSFWQAKYGIRRLRGLELNSDERERLTYRAVGEVAWHAASDEDREEMVTKDLWVTKNLEDWKEWSEVRKLGPGYQKRYGRWKKKQGSKVE